MILALQCWPGDAAQALELTKLICDIEPKAREKDIFCISARRDTPDHFLEKIVRLAEEKFGSTLVIRGQRAGTGWPEGSNDLWAETMLRVSLANKQHGYRQTGVLTFEPDCVPLRSDWIDALSEAWDNTIRRDKEVLGHAHGEPPDHINGNAIFRVGLLKRYGELNGAGNRGWDHWHGKLLLSIGEDTNLICQHYQLTDYDREYMENVRKNGVIPALFHGAKGFAAMQYVREMLNEGMLETFSKTPRA